MRVGILVNQETREDSNEEKKLYSLIKLIFVNYTSFILTFSNGEFHSHFLVGGRIIIMFLALSCEISCEFILYSSF